MPKYQVGIKSIVYKIFEILAVRSSNEYFACSIDAGKYLFKDKKFKVIPNAIEVEKFKYDVEKQQNMKKIYKLDDCVVIGHVGRFDVQKNHRYLIDVFHELKKNSKEKKYVLILIGNGPLESDIIKQIRNYNLMNDVLIFKDRKDVNELIQMFDVFLFPSLFEGLGIAALEAQFASIPTIVSNTTPSEVVVSKNIKFLPIEDKNIVDWVKEIKVFEKLKKIDNKVFFDNNYNIIHAVKILEKELVER